MSRSSYDSTPSTGRVVFYTLMVIVMIAVIGVSGYFLYFKVAQDSTTRRYNVNTHNQQYQAGLISQERDNAQAYNSDSISIANTTDPAVKQSFMSQQSQLKATFCQIYPNLDPPPADLVQANAQIC